MFLNVHSLFGTQLMTAEAPYAFVQVRYRLAAAHIYYSRRTIPFAIPAGYAQIIVEFRLWP
jgi:hypothetical protein